MEYLPGEDLNKLLIRLSMSNQHVPIHIAAWIMSRACDGLHFAHEMTDTAGGPLGLVHRDVNPANIVVTYGGEVKLIDFGVAKTIQTETQSGTIKGKIAYMSPEQLLALGVDRRSDVFSAGVVLWELLTRRPLFRRDSEGSTMYAIMNSPISPPSEHRPGIPRDLDAIVMRALSRNPVDRFDTAEEMGSALDTFLARQPRCDARTLGDMLETAFGLERAEAKRSIAKTCALGQNISLVMKLRTDIRSELAEELDAALADGSEIEEPAPRASALTYVLSAVVFAALAAGAFYVTHMLQATPEPSTAPVASASMRVESTPPGAAIMLDGEPTGLVTPATLTGLMKNRISIDLALPGYQHRTETIDVPATGTVTKRFDLQETR
jgi:serine/threonine-protein kinase